MRMEAGEPVLSAYELRLLAGLLDTTLGTWMYDDARAVFRGKQDRQAVEEAERTGREMMSRYLALEAACG
jgi:hypothetical protein